ncbi:hypothetical protein [Arthrobacter sp. UKPF54-2]|uniref:hypothetical protein n=1 Tax=Arthrobacter sp. UKPF54-2 TaxID=2600159 RepID=UPI001647F4A7|nr:hypothetical protein [Arthrobacter sp. UKPF54-2]
MAEMRWEMRAAGIAGPFFAFSSWLDVGFDEIYSMLFSGSSGVPGMNVTQSGNAASLSAVSAGSQGSGRGRFDVDAVVA